MWYVKSAPSSDFDGYRQLAENLIEYHQFGYPNPSAYRLPAYPMFLVIFMLISRATIWLSFWNVILSSLLILIIYHLTYKLTSGSSLKASMAALICSINPTFIFFSSVLASEHLFVILLFSSLLLLYCENIKIIYRLILSGFMLGITILTRGEGLFYIPIFILTIYLVVDKCRDKFIMCAVFLIICFITVSPWYLRNLKTLGPGAGLSTTGGINFYFAHNETIYGWQSLKGTKFENLNDIQAQKLGYQLGFRYLIEKPSRILTDILKGTKALYSSTPYYSYAIAWSTKQPDSSVTEYFFPEEARNYYWFIRTAFKYNRVLLLFTLLSLLFYKNLCIKMRFIPFGIIIMNWICYNVIFWGKPRYRFTSEIFFCILMGIALAEIATFITNNLIKLKQQGFFYSS